MKKTLSLLLAVVLTAGLCVSCNKESTGTKGNIIHTPPVFDDWIYNGSSPDPDPTPVKKPSSGVQVRYACSPTGAGVIDGTATQYIKSGGYTERVTAIPLYGYQFAGWSDGCTERSRAGDSVKNDTVYTANFIPVEVPMKLTVPEIHVNTASGDSIRSKSYERAVMTIVGADKEKYNLTNASLRIKGRGNSSWSSSYIGKTLGQNRWTTTKKEYETVSLTDLYRTKNSYTLKFDESVNLLGIGNGKNKDWILQANKYDLTGLRNKFMYMLAEHMGTLTWVTHCAWVNLYINGEYRGLYMIQEKPEAASDRVNIDDSGTDPDKGYLIELDFRAGGDSSKKEGLDYFYIPEFHKNDSNKREFDILSEHSTEAECAFIRDYMIRVDAAIRSHDRTAIEALLDVYSMVDIFLIEELGKDCDWGATSFYMYKEKGGRLYFTCPWDFDFCMGSYSSALNIKGLISAGTYGNEWFEELHDVPWFVELVQARMNSLEDDLQDCLVLLQKYALALKPYADQNNERWPIFGVNYHEYVSPQVSGLLCTYDEHVGFIYDWILYRWDILRSYYPANSRSPLLD